MKKLVREIHRRSLWQVLGIYLVTSWVVLQVVDTMSGALRLPDWASPMALVLLIVGLPIVLATALTNGVTLQDRFDSRRLADRRDRVDVLPPVAGGAPIVLCSISEHEISLDEAASAASVAPEAKGRVVRSEKGWRSQG